MIKRSENKNKAAFISIMTVFMVFGIASSLAAQENATESVSSFGGPTSVGGQFKKDDEVRGPIVKEHRLQSVAQPYFDFKERIKNKYGFTFGADYNAMFQAATESPGEDTAAGG